MNDRMSYTRTAISLHWLVALLVFAGWGIGFYAHELPASPDKARLFSWHKWIGVTVFLLAVLRAGWRVTHPAPVLPASVARWQQSGARISHVLLYLLLLVLPLSGWLMSSAKGFPTVYFGVLPLPDLLAKDEPLGKLLSQVHKILAFALAGLVAVHVAAAIKHHAFDRDDVLRRMLPALVAVTLALLLAASAALAPVATGASRITATFRQMNVPVEGEFTSFRGGVAFTPQVPGGSRATLEVDTGSFTLGDAEYDAEARGREWLDSKTHPRAVYTADRIAARGADRYVASGTLALKGRSVPLDVPFTTRDAKSGRVFEGEFPLSRKAFGIGGAGWADTLEDPVVVRFRIATQNR